MLPGLRVCTLRRVVSHQGDRVRKAWSQPEEDIPPYLAAPSPTAANEVATAVTASNNTANTTNTTNTSGRCVTCEICVAASSSSFSCLAMFCSNQSLLFRFVALGQHGTLHCLPWFNNDAKRILSMHFSGDVKHLLCLCADGSLYVVSVLALVLHGGPGASQQAADDYSMHLSSYARDPTAQSQATGFMGASSARFVQAVDLSQLPSQDVYLKFGVHGYVHYASSSSRSPANSPAPVRRDRSAAREKDAESVYSSGYATCCAWWSRVDNGKAYLLIGTSAGKFLVLSCDPPDPPPSSSSSSTSIPIIVVACLGVSQSALVDIKVVQNTTEAVDQWVFALATSESQNTYRIPLLFSGRRYSAEMHTIESTALWQHDLDIAAIAGLERASTNNMFKPEQVTSVQGSRDPTMVNLQSLGAKGFGLGMLNQRSGRLQLVLPNSPLPFEFPLFEFQTFAAGASSRRRPALTRAMLSNRILYTVSQDHQELSTSPASVLRINVLSALVAARCCSLHKGAGVDWNQARMQEFRLPAGWSSDVVGVFRLHGKMMSGAAGSSSSTSISTSTSSISTKTSTGMGATESQTLGSAHHENLEAPLDGVVIVTRDAVYECVPQSKEHLEDEFFQLVTAEATRPQGELLAQSLGINVLSMYEQAADRLLRSGGRASVALDLYTLSNATCEKITLELVKSRHSLLAASFARRCLSCAANGSSSERLSWKDSQVLARRIILCYVGSAVDSHTGVCNADANAVHEIFRDAGSYIPSGVATAAAPFTHPALLHYLETSSVYDLGPTLQLLLDKSLVGAMLVAAHSRDKIDDGIRLLLKPQSPRIGAAAMDFLVASGHTRLVCEIERGQLVRSLSLPLQIRFVLSLAHSFPHLLVDLLPLILSMLPRMGRSQLDDLFVALNSGSSATSLATLAAFKVGELSATVLIYMASGGDTLAHTKLIALLRDPLALSVRTDVMAARCADFKFWDAAAVVYEAQQNWLQVLRCRVAHIKTEKGVIEDPEYISVVEGVMANMTDLRVPVLEHVLLEWVVAQRNTELLETFLFSKIGDIGKEISLAVFRLDTASRRALGFSARFSFQMAKVQLKNNPDEDLSRASAASGNAAPSRLKPTSSRSRTESVHLWTEIRHNLAGMNTKKNRNVEVNAEVLLSCRRQAENKETNAVVAFTCGHAFAEHEFRDIVLPRFQKQMGGRIDLPITISALMEEYSCSNMVLPCPRCLFRALCQEAAAVAKTETEL